MAPPDEFHDLVRGLGIVFDAGDLERLGGFLESLLETSKQFNLTAIQDPDEAWIRHIGDSLSVLPNLAAAGARTVLDVGSGGGLPGVPLALVSPDIHFTLLEATGKKVRFLEQVTEHVDNVTVVQGRAEEAGQGDLRASFDTVLARAVGPLPTLLELTVPFAKVGGFVLAIKGEKAPQEVKRSREALHRLKSRVVDLQRTQTGTIVTIEKSGPTPKTFPRRSGEPKHNPL